MCEAYGLKTVKKYRIQKRSTFINPILLRLFDFITLLSGKHLCYSWNNLTTGIPGRFYQNRPCLYKFFKLNWKLMWSVNIGLYLNVYPLIENKSLYLILSMTLKRNDLDSLPDFADFIIKKNLSGNPERFFIYSARLNRLKAI